MVESQEAAEGMLDGAGLNNVRFGKKPGMVKMWKRHRNRRNEA